MGVSMRHFSSNDQTRGSNSGQIQEQWWLQGNLGRSRWRRWFRVAGTGTPGEEGIETAEVKKEDLQRVLEVVRERQYGKQTKQFTIAQDQTTFLPLASLEIGSERSRAICRIARYFSLKTWTDLIRNIEASENAADYANEATLKEIFAIPDQVAEDIFKPTETYRPGEDSPLQALKNLDESQLTKMNPIPIGTGFLVGGTHLMTNNHVIADPAEALECVAQFNYVRDSAGQLQQSVDYSFAPNILFVTNPALDYTLVQLDAGQFTRQAGYVFGWLQLVGDEFNIAPGLSVDQVKAVKNLVSNTNSLTSQTHNSTKKAKDIKAIPGDRVLLVQHPKGQEKQLVQNDNRVLDYDKNGLLDNFVRYTTDSDYGSSGSPVFNTNWDLVALHHAAIAKEDISSTKEDTTAELGTATSTEEPSTNVPPASASRGNSTTSESESKSKQPNIEASQGIRICRIVADLQAKSWENPKLKSFLEDFVVTPEYLDYPSLPSALNFLGGGNRYISINNSVGLLTGSANGILKIWSQTGVELMTLKLSGLTAKIEKLCFSADGTFIALVQSHADNQRSPIEIWAIQGDSLNSLKVGWQRDLISSHLIKSAPAKTVVLEFYDDAKNNQKLVISLSADGYLDIWNIEGTLVKTIDIIQNQKDFLANEIQKIEEEYAKKINELGPISETEDGSTSSLRNSVINEKQRTLKPFLDITDAANRYALSNPSVKCYPQHSRLVCNSGKIVSILDLSQINDSAKAIPVTSIQVKDFRNSPLSDIQNFALSPDGKELAILKFSWENPEGEKLYEAIFYAVNGVAIKSSSGEQKRFSSAINFGREIVYSVDGSYAWVIGNADILGQSFEVHFLPLAINHGFPDPGNAKKNNVQDWKWKISSDGCLAYALSTEGKAYLYAFKPRRNIDFLKTLSHENAIAMLPIHEAFGTSSQDRLFSFRTHDVYTIEIQLKPYFNASGSILAKGSRIGREYEIGIFEGKFFVNVGQYSFNAGPSPRNKITHLEVVLFGKNINQNDYRTMGFNDVITPKVYVDGQEVSVIPNVQFSRDNTPEGIENTPLIIGGHPFASSNVFESDWTSDQAILPEISSFPGVILEVRIWNKELPRENGTLINRNPTISKASKEQGLIGYWNFQEIYGNRVRNLADQGADGFVTGAEAVSQADIPSRFTSSLVFNSPNHWVNCGAEEGLSTPTAITVEAWEKHRFGSGVLVRRMATNAEGNALAVGYELSLKRDKICVVLQNGATKAIVETRHRVPKDRAFHHIAFTWDQSSQEVQIYLDGRRQDTVAVVGPYKTILIDGQYRSTSLFDASLEGITAPLYLGSAPGDSNDRRWNMAEVRLWNVARTQNQILNNMTQRLAEPQPGLVGYWRLDDGDATARNRVALWQGHSGPEHHGSIQRATWFPTALPSPTIAPVLADDLDFGRYSGVNPPVVGPEGGSERPNPPTDKTTGGGDPDALPSDIQNHWAKDRIRAVMAKQVMLPAAQGQFWPNAFATVGDYVTAVAAAFDQPLQFESISSADLPATDSHYLAAQKAYQMGFLRPNADNTFNVTRLIPEVEVLEGLVRGLHFKGGTLNLISAYPRAATLSLARRLALATALRYDLVFKDNIESRLDEHHLINRAQLAALIYQAWAKLGQAEAIPSDHFVQLQEPPALFVDVPADHWARPYIQGLVEQGITHGYNDGTFRPDLRLSRGDFAVLLVRAFDPQPRPDRRQANVSQLFVDVADNDPQTKFIQQIYRSGIMSGLPDRQFGVKAVISRAEAITAVKKVLELPPDHGATHRRYTDHRDIPAWAEGPIAAATTAGLIVGPNSDRIRATVPITRAEVASLIYQGWNYQTQKA